MRKDSPARRANIKFSFKKIRSIPLNVSFAQTTICFFFKPNFYLIIQI